MTFVFAFLTPFIIVLSLTPLFSKLAFKLDFTDKPTERKKHSAPVPLLGGLVMFIGFGAGFIFFAEFNSRMLFILSGCLLLTAIGMFDDYQKTRGREFPVLPRLLAHVAAAVLAFAADIRFTGFFNPFSDRYIVFPVWLQFITTVLWIMGLVNVINWMDGLDGLAGGLCTLSAFTLFVVALVKQQSDSALTALLLIGALLGFLRYNLPPPRMYMGDSGAYLLGYLLAVISLFGAFKQATVISVFVPVLAMGVPIFDSLFVVFHRMRARKPVYEADSSNTAHIHFRLLGKGMKPAHAVGFICLISACLNLTSIIILLISNAR